MKILAVCDHNLNENNGTTIRYKKILKIIKEKYKIISVSPSNKFKFDNNEITFKLPHSRQLFKLPFWELYLLIIPLFKKFDKVYIANDWYGFLPFYLWSKFIKFEIIFEAHGILSEENKEWGKPLFFVNLLKKYETFVISNSNNIISLSQNIYEYYSRFNTQNIIVPVFMTPKEVNWPKINLKKKYGIKEEDFIIGAVGPFDLLWNSGTLNLIKEYISFGDSSIKFLIIGKTKNQLLKDSRIIYTGYIEDYLNTLRCCNMVIVFPNISTSGPLNKIIESCSLSIPVFANQKAINGLYYFKENKDILISKTNPLNELKRIISNSNLKKIGLNAKEIILKHYFSDNYKTKIINLFL